MIQEVLLRSGEILRMGDEVTTSWHDNCDGNVFIVCEITPYEYCDSGYMVVAHLKGDPERKIRGFQKEGFVKPGPDGLDANWFKKIK
jgi:hypothetical protein